MSNPDAESTSVKSRGMTEQKHYAAISLYLFMCFFAVMVYTASQSTAQGVSLLTVGLALGKALILGKFILIGGALDPGCRISAPTLLHRVAWRSLGMLVVLIIFKVLEDLIVGMVHSKAISELLAERSRLTARPRSIERSAAAGSVGPAPSACCQHRPSSVRFPLAPTVSILT